MLAGDHIPGPSGMTNYEIAGSDTQTFLELFAMRTSSPSVRSSRPTTNVGAFGVGAIKLQDKASYLSFDYTPVIPRIDELFDVLPNVYGNSPRVMKLRDVRPSTVANRNYIMKYLRDVLRQSIMGIRLYLVRQRNRLTDNVEAK